MKLAARLCVRQIVTEPIICHSYPPECSHEDINRKRSHFRCKGKGRTLFLLQSSKAWIHTLSPQTEEWGDQQRRDKGRDKEHNNRGERHPKWCPNENLPVKSTHVSGQSRNAVPISFKIRNHYGIYGPGTGTNRLFFRDHSSPCDITHVQ
jgi:hypothetical protein